MADGRRVFTSGVAAFLLSALLVTPACGARAQHAPDGPPPPVVHDDRLQLTVFATEPEIVTPIGIAVDGADRIFVLESHTHLPPADYGGPTGDRVKVFTDANRDGRPDRVDIFAEGFNDGMHLAFAPDGELYLVTARAVWILHDRDRDGVSEARTRVLEMVQPERVYAHAALLGIAFSHDGWMYVSRGNTGGSPWRVEGTDGTFVSGYGDGGNIIRARPDGSGVHEFATGFWNPFDLKFDPQGRLLAADNDPDSRGPNRLVHVVEGGDYGYKSLYGGSGIHPYVSWDGELPGTLPYAVPLGEAPAGMIVGRAGGLPADYRDDLLITIWEERRIVRVRLEPKGTSVTGTASVLVEGDAEFRPVAFAADSRGTIYITDWVVREYPNHGRGRIWRLATKPGIDAMRPAAAYAPPEPDPTGAPLAAIYSAGTATGIDRLRTALVSEDPFIRHAAVTVLSDPSFRDQAVAATRDADARIRLGALLALHRGTHEGSERIARRLLEDPDPAVRRMTLVWIGSAGMASLSPVLDTALGQPASGELFDVYLATLEQLSPEFIRAYAGQSEPYARLLKRLLKPRFVQSFITDTSRPVALRAIAVTHLEDPASEIPLLVRLARAGSPPALRLEAVRSLALLSSEEGAAALLAIVRGRSTPARLRAEALLALARQPVDASADALTLLDDPDGAVRLEAARYLRSITIDSDTRKRVAERMAALDGPDAAALKAQLAFATGSGAAEARPASPGAWDAALTGDGNPEAGRRVFFSPQSACSQCHVAERRGGDLGPDLTNVGQSKSRGQILDAILRPSAEISPEYQGWFVRTSDGQIHTGRQIDVGSKGKAELYVQSGQFIELEGIVEYGPMPRSLMPDGLETNLTVGDMRDLLAFLERRGQRTGDRGPVTGERGLRSGERGPVTGDRMRSRRAPSKNTPFRSPIPDPRSPPSEAHEETTSTRGITAGVSWNRGDWRSGAGARWRGRAGRPAA